MIPLAGGRREASLILTAGGKSGDVAMFGDGHFAPQLHGNAGGDHGRRVHDGDRARLPAQPDVRRPRRPDQRRCSPRPPTRRDDSRCRWTRCRNLTLGNYVFRVDALAGRVRRRAGTTRCRAGHLRTPGPGRRRLRQRADRHTRQLTRSRERMDFGAHLPLMDFGGHPYTLDHLVAYTKTAAQLGFSALSVNDHMVFSVPWLDGPVALAAVMEHSGDDDAGDDGRARSGARTGAVAKTLGAIDRLSGGRLVVGRRSGLVGRRLRRRRSRLRGTLAAVRRGDRRAAGAVARRRCAVRRPLLLDRGSLVGTPAGATARTADLGGELGLGRRASPRGPSRRRLAGVGLQHDAGAVRRAWQALRSKLADHGKDPDTFPNALRRCGATSPTTAPKPTASSENGSSPPCTDPRTCSANVSRSARPSCSPRS